MNASNSNPSGLKRKICSLCYRPEKMCICHFIQPIDSAVNFLILQHPTEQKQSKGTAHLAHLCLNNSELLVTERLQDLQDDAQLFLENAILLYPPTEAFAGDLLTASPSLLEEQPNLKVVVLDGTWKKTHKMLALNPELQRLPRLSLLGVQESNYVIRKQKSVNSLSTIEAIANVLKQLENSQENANQLLDVFAKFQEQIAQFIPIEHQHR